MKTRTRDNIIYLAVGVAIAALAVADSYYATSHHTKGWILSRFAVRAVTTPSILAYFVVREMRRKRATLLQTLASVLFVILLQLAILFGFRQAIDQLPGIAYSALAVLEMFFLWQLAVQGVLYLIRPRH